MYMIIFRHKVGILPFLTTWINTEIQRKNIKIKKGKLTNNIHGNPHKFIH